MYDDDEDGTQMLLLIMLTMTIIILHFPEKLLTPSLHESGSVGLSMQSLVMSSGSGSSGSQLDQQIVDDTRISSSSSQSHMYCFTGSTPLSSVHEQIALWL